MGGAVTATQVADRIEAALNRIEAARNHEAAAAERLRALETVVETSLSELDTLLAGAR